MRGVWLLSKASPECWAKQAPSDTEDASSRSELPKTSSETLSGWILGQRRQEDTQENAKRNLPKMQQALPQQRLKAEARREWTAGSHNSSLRGKFEHACVLATARDDFLCTAQALSAELRSLASLKMPGSQREKCTCTHGLLRFLGCDGHLPGPGLSESENRRNARGILRR